MLVQACDPSTRGAEAGKSLSLRSALSDGHNELQDSQDCISQEDKNNTTQHNKKQSERENTILFFF